jgi:hypothetical protein
LKATPTGSPSTVRHGSAEDEGRTTDTCYYVPAVELGQGRSRLHLRLRPALSGRKRGINWARDYLEIRPLGSIEPWGRGVNGNTRALHARAGGSIPPASTRPRGVGYGMATEIWGVRFVVPTPFCASAKSVNLAFRKRAPVGHRRTTIASIPNCVASCFGHVSPPGGDV